MSVYRGLLPDNKEKKHSPASLAKRTLEALIRTLPLLYVHSTRQSDEIRLRKINQYQ